MLLATPLVLVGCHGDTQVRGALAGRLYTGTQHDTVLQAADVQPNRVCYHVWEPDQQAGADPLVALSGPEHRPEFAGPYPEQLKLIRCCMMCCDGCPGMPPRH
jgi:hypothetical protein